MIKAYQIKDGSLVEMGLNEVGAGGVSARGVIKKAKELGADYEQVRNWALRNAKIAIIDWPDAPEGKRIVEYARLSTDDLTGMPTPRLTLGPAVFAYEMVDLDPAPVPDAVSSRQFFEQLMRSQVISPQDMITWRSGAALPNVITDGLTTYVGTLPANERAAVGALFLNTLCSDPVFYRGDEQGNFMEVFRQVLGITEAQLDALFFAAVEL